MERISIRDAIFREVASNILIHREYTNAFPAKLIIERGQVRTENSNKPHGFGVLDPAHFTPFPKNPVIGAFFREIHRADELGSGMRKMMRYGKAYGGANPEMIEGDVFRIVVKVPEFSPTVKKSGTPEVTPQVSPQVGTKLALSRHQVEILRKCNEDTALLDLMVVTGRSDRTKFRHQVLNILLEEGLIEMTIPDKPRSSKQKYRLTNAGKRFLESIQK
jgi:ATP-dependent DNA helicase RecG